MTLRERQADAARSAITASALEVFLDNGYSGATMSDIAREAGVARQTVYNLFESKAALLLSIIGDRVAGSEERSQADDHRRILESTDPHQMIELFAEATIGVARRATPVLRIAYEAAAMDGDVAKHLDLNEEYRYRAQSFFVEALDAKGFLRLDIDQPDLKRGFWLLASPRMLVTALDSGWGIDAYATWLRESVAGLLLPTARR